MRRISISVDGKIYEETEDGRKEIYFFPYGDDIIITDLAATGTGEDKG